MKIKRTGLVFVAVVLVMGLSACFNEYYVYDDAPYPYQETRLPSGEYNEAYDFLQSLQLMEIGKELLLDGRTIDAIHYLRNSIGYNYFNPFSHFFLGTAYYRLGWWETALLEFNISNDLEENDYWNSIVDTVIGMTYMNMNVEQVSKKKYKKAYRENPKNHVARTCFIKLSQEQELEVEHDESEIEGAEEETDKGEAELIKSIEDELEKSAKSEDEAEVDRDNFFKKEPEYDKRDFEEIEVLLENYF